MNINDIVAEISAISTQGNRISPECTRCILEIEKIISDGILDESGERVKAKVRSIYEITLELLLMTNSLNKGIEREYSHLGDEYISLESGAPICEDCKYDFQVFGDKYVTLLGITSWISHTITRHIANLMPLEREAYYLMKTENNLSQYLELYSSILQIDALSGLVVRIMSSIGGQNEVEDKREPMPPIAIRSIIKFECSDELASLISHIKGNSNFNEQSIYAISRAQKALSDLNVKISNAQTKNATNKNEVDINSEAAEIVLTGYLRFLDSMEGQLLVLLQKYRTDGTLDGVSARKTIYIIKRIEKNVEDLKNVMSAIFNTA